MSSAASSPSASHPVTAHPPHTRRNPPTQPNRVTEAAWRAPTADVSDYFNYGLTERTWRDYTRKVMRFRAEFMYRCGWKGRPGRRGRAMDGGARWDAGEEGGSLASHRPAPLLSSILVSSTSPPPPPPPRNDIEVIGPPAGPHPAADGAVITMAALGAELSGLPAEAVAATLEARRKVGAGRGDG